MGREPFEVGENELKLKHKLNIECGSYIFFEIHGTFIFFQIMCCRLGLCIILFVISFALGTDDVNPVVRVIKDLGETDDILGDFQEMVILINWCEMKLKIIIQ